MNFIDKGLTWFEQRRKASATEIVSLTHKLGVVTVRASVIEPEQQNQENGIRVKTDHILFIVETKYLTSINVVPGVYFTRRSRKYEVITGKNRTDYLNDPNHLATVLETKLCS